MSGILRSGYASSPGGNLGFGSMEMSLDQPSEEQVALYDAELLRKAAERHRVLARTERWYSTAIEP